MTEGGQGDSALPGQDLLEELNQCFDNHPDIDEFDFVYLPPEENHAFLVVEGKLAVATWAIKPLFRAARQAFRRAQTQWSQHEDSSLLLSSSRAVLLINADVSTVWHARKRLLFQGKLSLEEELRLLDLVVGKHSKKPACWAHRKWCLTRKLGQIKEGEEQEEGRVALLQHELDIAAKAATQSPKNYYAWTHRLWLLPLLPPSLLVTELAFTSLWADRHISDASALNYSHQLLSVVRREGSLDWGGVVGQWWTQATRMLDRWPGHDSLWYHRRSLFKLVWESFPTDEGKEGLLLRYGRLVLETNPSPPQVVLSGDQLMQQPEEVLMEEGRVTGLYINGGCLDKGNLLWDEETRARQRLLAWAHRAWVVATLLQGGGGGRRLGQHHPARVELIKELLAQLPKQTGVLADHHPPTSGTTPCWPRGYLALLESLSSS